MNCALTEEFFSVMNLLLDEQKIPKDYGTGQLLYHSEVNFLDAIHKHKQANVSELSAKLGITKGAVTQTAGKLKAKGLIEIYMQEGNKKEKFFRLTDVGMTARKGHEQYHKKANESLCDYFRSLSDADVRVVRTFLNQLRTCVPFCQFTCEYTDCKNERR